MTIMAVVNTWNADVKVAETKLEHESDAMNMCGGGCACQVVEAVGVKCMGFLVDRVINCLEVLFVDVGGKEYWN